MTASLDSPARVLVVDDERSIVELVATALRYEGFQVETAATGRDALRSVASWRSSRSWPSRTSTPRSTPRSTAM